VSSSEFENSLYILMDQELTTKQTEIVSLFPATAVEIADAMGYSGVSTVYDHVTNIRLRGVDVGQNDNGEYFEIKTDGGAAVTNYVEPRRQTATSKAAITRAANEYLTELELEVKAHRRSVGPAVADGGLTQTHGGQDVVIHRTDDHFGDVVKDENGITEFNSEIAEHRVRRSFDDAHDSIQARQQLGGQIDTVHLLLGGDHVTNEAIYDGQAWEVDENIKEQLNRATAVYDEELERLSKLYPSVQVVCKGFLKLKSTDRVFDEQARTGTDQCRKIKCQKRDLIWLRGLEYPVTRG
jgi:hypothetical protein